MPPSFPDFRLEGKTFYILMRATRRFLGRHFLANDLLFTPMQSILQLSEMPRLVQH